jgi:hypothetical protein
MRPEIPQQRAAELGRSVAELYELPVHKVQLVFNPAAQRFVGDGVQ